MSVTKKDTEYVANLARLGLSEQEKELFTQQLNNILGYIDVINSLDTGKIEPTTSAVAIDHKDIVLREDKAVPFKDSAKILETAPKVEDNMFAVPRIWEE